MWGQLRIIQGGHLKIRGTGKNSNMRGHTKFLGGFEKIEGGGFQGSCYRGVLYYDKRLPFFSRVIVVQDFETVTFCVICIDADLLCYTAKPFSPLVRGYTEVR